MKPTADMYSKSVLLWAENRDLLEQIQLAGLDRLVREHLSKSFQIRFWEVYENHGLYLAGQKISHETQRIGFMTAVLMDLGLYEITAATLEPLWESQRVKLSQLREVPTALRLKDKVRHDLSVLVFHYGLWNAVQRLTPTDQPAVKRAILRRLRLDRGEIENPSPIASGYIPTPAPAPELKRVGGYTRYAARRGAKRDMAFVVDTVGNTWSWNCGWRRVDAAGNWLDSRKQPLGHSVFRRAIKLAPETEVMPKFARPWGAWRIMHKGVYEWGTDSQLVTLIMSDGEHAIVEKTNGTRIEVRVENLRRPRVIGHRPESPATRQKSERKTKAQQFIDQLFADL